MLCPVEFSSFHQIIVDYLKPKVMKFSVGAVASASVQIKTKLGS